MKSSAIREVNASSSDFSDSDTGESLHQDISLIGHVQVSLTAQVGTVNLSVERLFGLKQGEVITMNEVLEAPIVLMLNGRAVARAELLAVDDHFGVRILELA